MLYNQTLSLGGLKEGEKYIIMILIDHMGNDENFIVNADYMKDPRGLVDYSLNGRDKEAISWKITGNLGGEQYQDHSRGPFNEGAFYAERQGYHLPGAPLNEWKTQSPFTEITESGVGFWATSFDLDLPAGYDIPLSVQFTNSTTKDSSVAKFRSELFVNGWQFGKYGMSPSISLFGDPNGANPYLSEQCRPTNTIPSSRGDYQL
jgi:beta-galactosidase